MTNPQYGFTELAAAQSQPEVVVNAMLRALTNAVSGSITIDFASDADYELQATDPLDADDEWGYSEIRMTDSGVVLTTGRSVVFPDLDSVYTGPSRHRFVFVNDTAQTLTVLADVSGATGVAVSAGDKALVRYNGTDVELIATLP